MLTYGAAGGMGNALIDLARAEGIEVIGVVSSASKGEFAKELGAAHVINRKTENIAERVAAITGGRGVDIEIDPVGGPSFTDNLALIGSMGIVINYGGLAGRAEATCWPPCASTTLNARRCAPSLSITSTIGPTTGAPRCAP
jgi:NADPH:quinone reductase